MRMNFVQPSWPKFAFQEHPEEASICLDPSSSSFCLKSKGNDNNIESDPHRGDEVDYSSSDEEDNDDVVPFSIYDNRSVNPWQNTLSAQRIRCQLPVMAPVRRAYQINGWRPANLIRTRTYLVHYTKPKTTNTPSSLTHETSHLNSSSKRSLSDHETIINLLRRA
jgi:hypothetical protein